VRSRTAALATVVVLAVAMVLVAGQPGLGQPSTTQTQAVTNGAATTAQRAQAVARSVRALALPSVRAAVHASAGEQFSATRGSVDLNGTGHVRFNRSYHGLQVVGGDFIVHTDAAGAVTGVTSGLSRPLTMSTTPRLGAARATTIARRVLATQGGRAANAGSSLVVGATWAVSPPKLAWQVTFDGVARDGVPSRLVVLVSASNGRVLDSWDEVLRVAGSGTGVHEGRVRVDTTQSGTTFQMRDPLRGGAQVRNANGGQTCTGSVLTDADNVWGTGAATNTASKGVDVSYGMAREWDLLASFGRNGWNGAGGGVIGMVNTPNQDNAFWNGSCAVFLDGGGGTRPFTAIDVVAHEFGHAIVQFTAGLRGGGQPGALNESSGDVFGSLTEFAANNPNDPPDYTVGEEMPPVGPFRNMANPSLFGDPNCANTTETEVHSLAGPSNHAYFMMAEGSGATAFGTSPTCNGSTVTGIGRSSAGRIWLRALDVYLPSNGGFTAMRSATVNAARDLFGLCTAQYRTVQAAWSAVLVNGSDAAC
jgi:Zn-dependent metalloprotease